MNVEETADKVWVIEDSSLNICLIEGREKALLIDTGWGTGRLLKVVSSLTSLPLIVVNTHGHIDHISGNFEFDHAYIKSDDLENAHIIFTKEYRTHFIERFAPKGYSKGFPSDFLPEGWIEREFDNFISLDDIKYFDLGDRIVDIINTPGHTAGSICLFDNNSGLLFSGDTISEGNVLVNLKESLSLGTFLNSIDNLIAFASKINYIVPYHGRYKLDPSILYEHKDAVEKILSGEIKGTPRNSVLGNGLFCRFNAFTLAYSETNL